MQIYGFKVHIILLVFLVVLGSALGIRHLVYQQRVVSPLEEDFRQIAGVEDVRLVHANQGPTEIHVTMAAGGNVRAVHREVLQVAGETLWNGVGPVRIQDARSPELEEIYYHMHFAVQEGIATGRFGQMAAEIDRLSAEAGLDRHRVYVDDRYVYVDLAMGDNQLYEIITRETSGRTAGVHTGGGDGS